MNFSIENANTSVKIFDYPLPPSPHAQTYTRTTPHTHAHKLTHIYASTRTHIHTIHSYMQPNTHTCNHIRIHATHSYIQHTHTCNHIRIRLPHHSQDQIRMTKDIPWTEIIPNPSVPLEKVELGRGTFGIVVRALWQEDSGKPPTQVYDTRDWMREAVKSAYCSEQE